MRLAAFGGQAPDPRLRRGAYGPFPLIKKITLGACKYETVVRNKQPSGLPVRGGLPMTSFVAIRQLPVRHFEEYHFFLHHICIYGAEFFTARAAIFNT